MFDIEINNNKKFFCETDSTILQAAKNAGIVLEHSCLSARCRSCIVHIKKGTTINNQEELVLTEFERNNGYVLSCNAMPTSNLKLDIEILEVQLSEVKTFPCKIDVIDKVSPDVLEIALRLPPNSKFKFISGQYINIIKGAIKRSYSIASTPEEEYVQLYIKKYDLGIMSHYWFNDAKKNDLLRLEGPLGTFFLRNLTAVNDVVFLATGTGIAPVKSILDYMDQNSENYTSIKIWLVWGGRYLEDFFLEPLYNNINITFIPVLSRQNENWTGEKGYVQDVIITQNIDFKNTQVYACGSNLMITSAKKVLIKNELQEHNFYSDAFVSSN